MKKENELLVKKAKKGDDNAFYQLITFHKMQLYRIAISYFRNDHDALEAIQETTFRAYKSIGKLKKPEFFSTWLVRILLNYCHDELLKKKRIIYNDEILQSKEATGTGSKMEIDEAIQLLDEKYRRVIILKYLEGMKIDEIAALLEHPQGTIKTWLHKGLQALRIQFTEDEEDSNV
ncbi:sigma-70 family RNA polymerase sigma factor [Rossellomorea vietnamensis]|uniref:Sigma-70 family RNA polymerase sigma factor n=1 Tax=Rossellomorea vietnamensis TaxID=218284 RepID=A0A5D4NPT7_9BACI|nr:sigma-70 family RNA polymerase sigma factor [Rossellomorea vietnamensis]TYS15674.1 sigma-70 family RNA polymerase sigma factor [Rossellomorea vietnamensis]